MKPNFTIIANDKNITEAIKKQFISLTISDRRGMKSDEISLVLNDINGLFVWPKKGAELKISIGYDSTLIYKGLYKVDKVRHSGPPDKLTITAKAADMTGSLKAQHSQSYHQQSIKQIVDTIAGRHGLKSAVAEDLGAIIIEHIDQAEESDLHFLTRLARRYDAIAKPANDTLLFIAQGEAKTASGKAMPEISVHINELSQYSLEELSRTQYSGVKTYYHSANKARRTGVLVGEKGQVKTIKQTYANEAEARDKAKSEFKRLKRLAFKGELVFKHGRADISAESLVTPTGAKWRDEYRKSWIAGEVNHTLSSSEGLSSRVTFETY